MHVTDGLSVYFLRNDDSRYTSSEFVKQQKSLQLKHKYPFFMEMVGSEGKNVGAREEYISKEDIATALSKTDTETENFWHLG